MEVDYKRQFLPGGGGGHLDHGGPVVARWLLAPGLSDLYLGGGGHCVIGARPTQTMHYMGFNIWYFNESSLYTKTWFH